jgi:hypothetical protein
MSTPRKTHTSKKAKQNAYYSFPNSYAEEGVDHININIQSNLAIGKIFDPGYVKVINYPYIGKFQSVSSLWYWLRSEKFDDALRKLTGKALKDFARNNSLYHKQVHNFKAIIGYATWIKVKHYPHIIDQIKKLDDKVVILSYHVIKSSGVRVCSNYAEFIIDIANEIIAAIKESREPDFVKFANKPDLVDFNYLEGFLSTFKTPQEIQEMRDRQST